MGIKVHGTAARESWRTALVGALYAVRVRSWHDAGDVDLKDGPSCDCLRVQLRASTSG